jgi:fructoselysine-6-P-deglycase FrlB-like protein
MSLTYYEIHAQYDALDTMFPLMEAQAEAIKAYALKSGFRSIAFLGCGSSYAVACSAASSAAMRFSKPVFALAGGDVWMNSERYAQTLRDALIISISRSGSTSEILRAIESLGGAPAGVISFICAENSALENVSGFAVVAPFAYDESICQTRTVSCLFLGTQLLVAFLAGDEKLTDGLRRAVSGGRDFMKKYEPACAELANSDWDKIAVLSDAELDGIGAEGALAFKEICQLHSNYYHLLDSRHGPMVIFGPKTLVIAALNHNDNGVEGELIADIIKKGCKTVIYTDNGPALRGASLSANFGETLPHPARGLPLIALCQLLSYHKAAVLGVDPDKPAGLSAWIKI